MRRSLVKAVSTRTSAIFGMLVVIGTLYLMLAIVVSPLAARLIGAQRSAR
jgi:hypothetical protein